MLRCASPPERGPRRASFRTSPNHEGHTAAESEGRFRHFVRATLEEVGGASYDVRLEVNPEARSDAEADADVDDVDDEFEPVPAAQPPAPAAERRPDDLPVNPRYTFEAFVIGASNR